MSELFNVEKQAYTFKITDPFDEKDVKFIFEPNELPDFYNKDGHTALNHIEYQDGHQTNQIFGSFDDPVEFSGNFSGPCFDALINDFISAKEKSDILHNIRKEGKPVKFIFGMSDFPGEKGIFVIDSFKTNIKNYYDIDYIIRLIPHEPQTRVSPTLAKSEIKSYSPLSIVDTTKKITKKASTTKKPKTKEAKTMNDNVTKRSKEFQKKMEKLYPGAVKN